MEKCFCWSVVIGLLVITGSQTTTAATFYCYKCVYSKNGVSVNSPSCNDPFNATVNEFALSAACTTSCYKLVLKSGTLEEKVDRGCFVPSDDLPTCKQANFDDGTYSGSLSCCTTDRCNGNELPSGQSSTTALVLQTGSKAATMPSFKCYKCEDCNDPFKVPKDSAITCTTSCYKVVAKNGDDQSVQRGCVPDGNTCKDEKFINGNQSVSLSCCQTKLCNVAESTWNSLGTAAAAITGLLVAVLVQ